MTESQLYQQADQVLGQLLIAKGFRIAKPGEYLRRVPGGEDRVLVSKGPPSKAQSHFAVYMSYYPDYLSPVFGLVDYQGEDRGFPCGPYLTPVGATRRPKFWSFQNPEVLAKSLQHVVQCMEEAGLPWLESLRDPKVFAANVDPVAALPSAVAHEAAGNLEQARSAYENSMRRFLVPTERYGEAIGLKGREKAFIYVSKKLNVEAERRERLQRQLNYYPNVEPLS